jgi:MFS family permease
MFSTAHKRYVLGVLTIVYTLNFLDRGLIILLLQPIKADLHLSDTQLGFLTGIAFGLFYAVLGLPIARRADRGNRVAITSLAIGLWGATVIACLFVTNFIQLVFARISAAVGEAGCMPPTYSLLGDYFPRAEERTRAMSIYMLAGPLSALVSFIAGGWLNEHYGWRVTLSVMGIPGLLVSLLVKLTVAEPRVHMGHAQEPARPMPRISYVLSILWYQRSSRHLILGVIWLWMLGLGLGPWQAAFMMRTHGMATAELGVWLGLTFGLGGIAGILLGGYVAGRWFARNERGQMRFTAVTIVLVVPCYVLFLLLPRKHDALVALIPVALACNVFVGPAFALMQRLVANEMRATTMAVVMMLANLIGMGIGPQLVGIFSDLLAPVLGGDSLRYAMLLMSLAALFAAFHFWRVGRTVMEDLSAHSHRTQFNLDPSDFPVSVSQFASLSEFRPK